MSMSMSSHYKISASQKKFTGIRILRKCSLENGIIYLCSVQFPGMSAGTLWLFGTSQKIPPSLHFLIPLYIPVPTPSLL